MQKRGKHTSNDVLIVLNCYEINLFLKFVKIYIKDYTKIYNKKIRLTSSDNPGSWFMVLIG